MVGQKDISTVVFNIVLHTIFLKLAFELEHMARAASLFIVVTIGLSYIIIALAESPGIALAFDTDLIGIGRRSVLSLDGFLLLVGICAIVLFLEYAIMYCRYLPYIVK